MFKCQACGSSDCFEFLDLGKQPICNRFLKDESSFKDERFYPLNLLFCRNCTLVQLGSVPPANETFGEDYNYLSGATTEVVRYFQEMAHKLHTRFDLKQGDYVVDIGSNDGTFLKACKSVGLNVLGVEPAPRPYAIAIGNEIDTINRAFEDAVDQVQDETRGRLRLITAFNVIAHTNRIHEFLVGINRLLNSNDANFVSQSHYFPSLIDKCQYDTIYHEHARFYTLTSLENLFKMHEIKVFDIEKSNFYGGSIVVYASTHSFPVTTRLADTRLSEKRFSDLRLYESFGLRVEMNREKLVTLLNELKSGGRRIVGIGAPMKASTMLNYCQIDSTLLDYLTEVNPLKINTYSPGTHIKVVDEGVFFNDPPDVALILSWNVADRIVEKLRSRGYKGSFVIPIPEPKVID